MGLNNGTATRTWRVRFWIRTLSLLHAAGWAWLVVALGVPGGDPPWVTAFLGFVIFGVPFLALWPKVRLRSDGQLLLRGWTRVRRAQIGEIARLSMNQFGLRFDFADGTRFTCVIFQATLHVHYPRVFDFVEAVTGERPSLEDWNAYDAALMGGIQLFPAPVRADHPLSEQDCSPDADFSRAVDVLESVVHELVGLMAEVTRFELEHGQITIITVAPANTRARAITLIFEQFLVVQLGDIGGRWELGYDDDDLAFARKLLDAAVAGRVTERFAMGRSRVEATFGDGTTQSETGYHGCMSVLVPQPGWKAWGKHVRYEPYQGEADTALVSQPPRS